MNNQYFAAHVCQKGEMWLCSQSCINAFVDFYVFEFFTKMLTYKRIQSLGNLSDACYIV